MLPALFLDDEKNVTRGGECIAVLHLISMQGIVLFSGLRLILSLVIHCHCEPRELIDQADVHQFGISHPIEPIKAAFVFVFVFGEPFTVIKNIVICLMGMARINFFSDCSYMYDQILLGM